MQTQSNIFLGVHEIVDRTLNAYKIATATALSFGATVILFFTTETIMNSSLPYGLSYTTAFAMLLTASTLVFLFTFVLHRTALYGPVVTPNSDLSYRNLADFMLSSLYQVGGSRSAATERAVGYLSVDDKGTHGVVAVSIDNIISIQIKGANQASIRRKPRLPFFGSPPLGICEVLLAFQNESDRQRFVSQINAFMIGRQ